MSTIVKKLSIATLHGKLTKEEKETIKGTADKAGESIFIGRFFGVATGSKTGVSQYGPWTALTGSFAGIDSTGEEKRASQCLLPMGLAEQIALQLSENEGSDARFSVDVFAKYHQIGDNDGHEYFIKSHDTPAAEDPLNKIAAALPALPVAPKQLAITEEKKAETVAEEKPVVAAKSAKK